MHFCVYGMALYWPTLQFCICVYVSFVCRYMAPLVSVITTLLCCNYFSLPSVVLHAFSAMRVFKVFTHHPHTLGYLCTKFRLFCGRHCWASSWTKIANSITHSIDQSLTQLIWCPGNWSLCFGKPNLTATKIQHKSWNNPWCLCLSVSVGQACILVQI